MSDLDALPAEGDAEPAAQADTAPPVPDEGAPSTESDSTAPGPGNTAEPIQGDAIPDGTSLPNAAPPSAPETPPTVVEQPISPAPIITLAAVDDTASAEPTNPLVISTSDLLVNDTLPTGTAQVVAVGDASHGSVSFDQGNQLILFDADDDFLGPGAGFSYTIADQTGAQATARVAISVAPEVGAGPPVLVDDQVSTLANHEIALPANQLLANDHSPGPDIDFSGVNNPVHGTVGFDPSTGTVTFSPEQNFVGLSGFDYLATAGSVGATAHVSVTVTAPPPDAVDDTAIIQGNRAATLPAALLLANDHAGLPGGTTRIAEVGAPQHGSVGLDRAGDVVFAPERDFVGDARFDYTITDSLGGRDSASVLVHVTEPPPDAPVQPPVVNITQTATITQVAIINQIVQAIPATTRIPADGGDGGAAEGLSLPAQAWFAATSPQHGTELWGYDGLDVAELADINRGAASSLPADMVSIAGTLLFSAADLAHGREPWVFDGASALQLGDLNAGDEGSNPAEFTLAGRTLYFTADDGGHGREVWSASAGAVRMVADLAAGPQGSAPAQLSTAADTLFFTADDGASGEELWRVASGGQPMLMADLNPGQVSSAPDALTEVNGTLYFIADDGLHGRELFAVRPGAAVPMAHDEFTPGGDGSFARTGRSEPLAELDGRLYAVAAHVDHGAALWVSNPQGGPFERLGELGAGLTGRVVSVETEAVGGRLYVALSDSAGGHALASYNTADGRLDQDVAGDPGAPARVLTAVGDSLFYTLADAEGIRTLWQNDGIEARRIDLGGESQPHDLTAVRGSLAFSAGGRLGVVDPDGAGRATFVTAEDGGDYAPTDITPVHPDALLLI